MNLNPDACCCGGDDDHGHVVDCPAAWSLSALLTGPGRDQPLGLISPVETPDIIEARP